MDITYFGHSSFRLKGKQSVVVTDPFDDRLGKFPKGVTADIVTISHEHDDHNQLEKITGEKFVIRGPGEYEVGGVSVFGIPTFHDDQNGQERGHNIVYVIELDGMRIMHAGDLGHKLSQAQLGEIGPVDILLIPTGGTYTIDAKTAVEVTRQTDPMIVIPMHYQTEETKLSEALAPVTDFLKEIGKPDVAPAAKYSITTERLPQELQVVVLERKA